MTHKPTHTDDHLAKRVLERIDAERVSPRPRWEFIFKNYFFWGLGALAVILGALAVSAMFFEITSVDWRFVPVTHESYTEFLFDIVPVLWATVLALFIVIGYLNIRRTQRGYRYPLWLIAAGAVLTSLALGSALYVVGVGRAIEETAGNHPPFHRPIMLTEQSWWLAPERGLLGGTIVSVPDDYASFVLEGFDGTTWTIDTSDLRAPDLTTVVRGAGVRVVGLPAQAGVPVAATSSIFHACFVFPWEFHGGSDRGLAPPPATASSSERNVSAARSEACRGIRPYNELRSLDETGR